MKKILNSNIDGDIFYSENIYYSIKKSLLSGRVRISGAKNSALKLVAASLLTDETVEISNSPNGLIDMGISIKMAQRLGKKIGIERDTLRISGSENKVTKLFYDGVSIRTTLLFLGSLLSRYGEGSVPIPGGCKIGSRKYDIHEYVMKSFGAEVREKNGYLNAWSSGRLRGCRIVLPIRSTGATENAMFMAALAKGKTQIFNPHIRPEIIDLALFLEKMGAEIKINGQESICINGVRMLKGVKHRVIPDSMEALTYLIAAMITESEIEIEEFPFSQLEVPMIFLRESGLSGKRDGRSYKVKKGSIYPFEISTGPYPGINSDMQPIFAALALKAKGTSMITDLRFPERYEYAAELQKLGATIKRKKDFIIIEGGKNLRGSIVNAIDLRCGAALVLAGLISEGTTVVRNGWQIDRGYEALSEKMGKMGGKVKAFYEK